LASFVAALDAVFFFNMGGVHILEVKKAGFLRPIGKGAGFIGAEPALQGRTALLASFDAADDI
jgi:hypothetical protein